MARASVKYIPLDEEYEATAPSDDVSRALKKGNVSERSGSDNQWEKLKAVTVGLASAWESRNKIDKNDADVYWPLDENWYCGHISGYNPFTDRHQVK
ncbi:hypothetical protein AgCh_001362 [Apium graveolens]